MGNLSVNCSNGGTVGPRRPQDCRGVLNREAAHMPFQSDATVRYALGEPSVSGLTYGDLRIKSPYNTYRTVGYPPGPISNPGMTMLKAALHPAHVSYLYF